ncbi:hypothetical protein D9613_002380 [Agrocybe pediades]|uniref:Uncharacterized protein n=1 Tax=Agrocybe pediades TaxID=84607 RepID=A0A8H4R5L6_9AGAR|nr:hypothetical protein D9613_002380 [Agrocybe pediades]
MPSSPSKPDIEPVYPRPPDSELRTKCRYCGSENMARRFDLCQGLTDARNYGRWMQRCNACYKFQYHSEARHPEEHIPEALRMRQALASSAKQAKTQILCPEPGCRLATKNSVRAANKLCTNKSGPLCADHSYLKGGCRGAHKDIARGYKPEMQGNDILSVSKPPTALSISSSSSAASSHLPRDSQPDSSSVKTSTHVQPRQLYGRPLDPGYRYRDPQAEQEAIRKRATFEAHLLEDEAKVITLYFFYDITKGPLILKSKPHIELPTSSKFILRDEPMFMTTLRNTQIPESAIAYFDLTITPPSWIILSDPGIPITVIHGQSKLVLRDARKEAGAFEGLPHLLQASLSITTDARPSKKICALDIRQPSGPSTLSSKPQNLSNKKNTPKSIVDLPPSTVKSGFDKLIALLDDDAGATFKDTFPRVFPNMMGNTTAYRYFSFYKNARATFEVIVNRIKFDESKSLQKVWSDLKQEVEKARNVQADSTPVCFELKDIQLDNPSTDSDLEIVEVKKGYLENSPSSTGRYHSVHKVCPLHSI